MVFGLIHVFTLVSYAPALVSPNTCDISVSLFFLYMVVLFLYDLLESGKIQLFSLVSVSWLSLKIFCLRQKVRNMVVEL